MLSLQDLPTILPAVLIGRSFTSWGSLFMRGKHRVDVQPPDVCPLIEEVQATLCNLCRASSSKYKKL